MDRSPFKQYCHVCAGQGWIEGPSQVIAPGRVSLVSHRIRCVVCDGSGIVLQGTSPQRQACHCSSLGLRHGPWCPDWIPDHQTS